MPLSEHEQRLLEQMERALYAEDPKLASALRGADFRAHQRRRVILGTLGVVVGLGLLLAGVTVGWGVGLAGFLVMLASAWWILTGLRSPSAPVEAAVVEGHGAATDITPDIGPGGRTKKSRRSKAPKASGGMMDRFEDRWRRRREGDDR